MQRTAARTSDSGSSYDSASDTSGVSSASSHDHFRSRGRPRKRTTTAAFTSSQSRLKRLKSLYNDDYRELFNSTVTEVVSKKSSKTDDLLQGSQIGVTLWSSEEKETFFRALVRRGRHDIRGIANDIGTKSESEVYVYSDILSKAAVDQQMYQIRKILLDTTSLEAALEVQEDCCAALDLAAEALSTLQQDEEERTEKKKYEQLALLTPKIARWVERCIVVPEEGNKEATQQIPAARLLILKNFLALSKRFFMNSVIAEDNWRSYTRGKFKSPSIMYTAFSDFYAVLISITQRLVQSSLFFAMSRLRAMSASGHYRPGLNVRRRDVMAAINVLGMRTDAKRFWATAARRCKLRIYDKVRHRQVLGKRYSYAEVERLLSPRMIINPDSPEVMTEDACTSMPRTSRTSTDTSASASVGASLSDLSSVDGGLSSASSNDEELSATLLHSTNNQDYKQERHGELQDAYAEEFDRQAGRDEESCLWELLGENPAEKMEPVNVKLPKAPFPNRKGEDALLDWRDLVDYAGDWETHKTPVLGSSYAKNRGFNKDVDLAAGLTSSGSSSGSVINDMTSDAEDRFDAYGDADSDSVTDDHGPHTSSANVDENGAGIQRSTAYNSER